MSEAIAFFCGLIAMAIVWFIQDTKYNPYMRGYADGLNDGIQEVNRMGDYISRQAAIDAINRAVTKEAARWSIQELSSAQPERKKGEWIPAFDGKFTGGAYWLSCSNCKRIVPDVRNGGWNYCPNCGADMRGGQNESD